MTQASDWQGRLGQVWAEQAAAMDRVLGPVGQAGIDALGSLQGSLVLDLGCGAGESTRALAALGAHVTGIDISQDLLEAAKARVTGPHTQYRLADASRDNLEGDYDCLYSRFGTMFFADPVQAWKHIRAEVGDDCRFSFVTWRPMVDNEWASIPMLAARPVLGEQVTSLGPTEGPGPFAWANPEVFVAILASAGWRDIEWKEVNALAEISMGDRVDPIDRAVEFAMTTGPMASRTKGVPPEQRKQIAEALFDVLGQYLVDDVVKLGTSAWVIEGSS